VGDSSKLDLKINLGYKYNFSNENLRFIRRSKFICALLATLRKVGINAPGGGHMTLGDASKPMYSVTTSENEARSRKKENLLRIKRFEIEQ
jgi:hypothetical protein